MELRKLLILESTADYKKEGTSESLASAISLNLSSLSLEDFLDLFSSNSVIESELFELLEFLLPN